MNDTDDLLPSNDDVRVWERDLLQAGWTRHLGMSTVWRSPSGALYRGPYGAWLVMNQRSATRS